MPTDIRTFSLASDFSGQVDLGLLSKEVTGSSITKTLDSVEMAGDVVDLLFADTLTSGDITELGSLVGNHDASNISQDLKLFRYLTYEDLSRWPASEPPVGLNYRTGLARRLEREVVLDKGIVTFIRYHDSATVLPDGTRTYSDLVIEEEHSYTRDVADFAVSRDVEISWFKEDGTAHSVTKILHKTYSNTESIREGKRRRSNIIDGLEILVAGMLMGTEISVLPTHDDFGAQLSAALDLGRDFLSAHASEINDFVEGSMHTLLDVAVPAYSASSIQTPGTPWMDNDVGGGMTIRLVISDALDIWS